MRMDLQFFGGRGAGSGSGGTTSGQSSNGTSTSGKLTSSSFQSELESFGGKALTSNDINQLGGTLATRSQRGDTISVQEPNNYYRITQTYTKGSEGWKYERKNQTNGQVYESRNVSSRDAASNILSTAHSNEVWRWNYRRKNE